MSPPPPVVGGHAVNLWAINWRAGFVFVFLRGDVVRDRFGQELLDRGVTVVGQGELHVERQRTRVTGQPAAHDLGFVELMFRRAGGRRPDAGFAREALDLKNLALGFGLGTGRKVFTDALAVQPAGNAGNDLPGGIRAVTGTRGQVARCRGLG